MNEYHKVKSVLHLSGVQYKRLAENGLQVVRIAIHGVCFGTVAETFIKGDRIDNISINCRLKVFTVRKYNRNGQTVIAAAPIPGKGIRKYSLRKTFISR